GALKRRLPPMSRSLRRLLTVAVGFVTVAATGPALSVQASTDTKFAGINHIVVIYEENHSFDNLFGGWEGVNGLANADAAHTTQVSQAGLPYTCLEQDDVNLTSPPLQATCSEVAPLPVFQSAFRNAPFTIEDFIKPTDVTCPKPRCSAPRTACRRMTRTLSPAA